MDLKNKDIELRSDEVQEVMSEISPSIVRWGITVIFIVLLTLIIGSFIFKYPDTISGTVTITTEEPPAPIIARATGKIDTIYVLNNQEVKIGSPLGVIQNPAKTADMLMLKERMEKWKNRDIISAGLLFDSQPLQLGSVQNSYATFLSILREFLDFEKLKYYPRKISLQEQQVKNQKQNLVEISRQSKWMKQQLETAIATYKRDSLLFRKGVVSDDEFDAAKNKLLQNRQSYSAIQTSIKQAEIGINQCESSLLDLQQDFNKIENKYCIDLRITTEQLITDIKSWERSYLLISPINGIVNLMGFWSNNQNVQSGETIFTIIPTQPSLPVGKALLPVQGSGKVRIGQKVNVRINNYPDQEFGYLKGFVKNISETPNAKGLYVVEIRFPNGLSTNYNVKLPISRQMEGNAEIITEDIRLIERFFNPIKKLLKKHL